jgi:tight adherence protein C
MVTLIAVLIAVSIGTFLLWAFRVSPVEPALVRRLRTAPMEMAAGIDPLLRRRRQIQSERLKDILETLGRRMGSAASSTSVTRAFLTHAGFPSVAAPAIYFGARIALAGALGMLGFIAVPLFGGDSAETVLATFFGAALGWVGPVFYVGGRMRARQKEIVKALPDALDLLVVCVEAGLGLNQAMVRVSEEIGSVSPVLAEQLNLTNLEMRAGTAREEALRNLSERTGVEDIQAFVTMLIQTDRFGTAIADALRVHSDTLRVKRRQRAEEAAAKTAIKMLFPLVFFIFPAIFVVILGPAVIQITEALGGGL